MPGNKLLIIAYLCEKKGLASIVGKNFEAGEVPKLNDRFPEEGGICKMEPSVLYLIGAIRFY